MSLDADVLVDRRRLRRSVTTWRVLAVVAIVAAIAGISFALFGGEGLGRNAPHIARLPIEGVITDDRDTVELIEELALNDNVKGVVLYINSPGGSTTGGEVTYNALRKLAEKKPVVAQIGTLGASAGYMIALSADHIVAHYTSLTGSIGVLMQYGQIHDLLERLGVEVNMVHSGPLKAEPSPFDTPPQAAVDMLQGIVMDSYDWFVGLVVERRSLDDATVRTLADGRVYTGHQALGAKLIDEIGDQTTAIDWLGTERGVDIELPVRTWKTPDQFDDLPFTSRIAYGIADRLLGAVGLDGALPYSLGGPVQLDGLVSLWHGPNPPEDVGRQRRVP